MTEERVKELTIEETHKIFPELELTNPSYFLGIVEIVTNRFLNDYALNALGSDSQVKELIAMDLGNLKTALK